jgi:hypothetical protein
MRDSWRERMRRSGERKREAETRLVEGENKEGR